MQAWGTRNIELIRRCQWGRPIGANEDTQQRDGQEEKAGPQTLKRQALKDHSKWWFACIS